MSHIVKTTLPRHTNSGKEYRNRDERGKANKNNLTQLPDKEKGFMG